MLRPNNVSIVLLTTAVVAFADMALSVEYSTETALEVTAQHDDNIRLDVNNAESVYGHSINPSVKSDIRSETWDVSADLKLQFSEFSDEGYDSDDQYLTFNGETRSEKYTAGFTGQITRDTTRTSETGDSGRVSNDRRELYIISPYWQYPVTESNLVSISGSAQKVDYKSADYIGYEYWSGQLQWTHVFNERLRLNANVNTSDYDSDGLTDEYTFVDLFGFLNGSNDQIEQTYFTSTKGVGYQFGFQYQLAENLSFDGLWGKSDTETTYSIKDPEGACNDPAFLLGRGVCDLQDNDSKTDQKNISLKWDDELNSFYFSYALSTQPSSDGYVLESEVYKLAWNHRLFRTGVVSIDASYGENEALGGSSLGNRTLRSERDYWTAVARYSHQVFEHWFVKASVRYRYQDRKFDRDDAEALGGRIGIEYRPTKFVW